MAGKTASTPFISKRNIPSAQRHSRFFSTQIVRFMNRNITLLALFIGLLSSCGPRKATLQNRTQTDLQEDQYTENTLLHQQQTVTATDSTQNNRQQGIQVQEIFSEEWSQLHLKLYDTDQPPDSLRGERPLLADMTLYREGRTTTQTQQEILRREISHRAHTQSNRQTDTLSVRSQQQTSIASEHQILQKESASRRTPLLFWIIGLGVLLIAGYLLRHKLHNQ